jgi:hypothetical protein
LPSSLRATLLAVFLADAAICLAERDAFARDQRVRFFGGVNGGVSVIWSERKRTPSIAMDMMLAVANARSMPRNNGDLMSCRSRW